MDTRQTFERNRFRERKTRIGAGFGFALFVCLLGTSSPAWADSGFAVVTPNTVAAGSDGNNFTFTYTATEDMGNGAVRMTTPNGFPNPTDASQGGNTTVTVVDGLMADIIDDLETDPLPEGTPGWNVDDGLPILNLANIGADTQHVFAGSQSVHANFLLNLGLPILLHPQVHYNYAANDARNWSAYTHFSFMIRTTDLVTANIDLGQGELAVAEGHDLNNRVTYDLSNALLEVFLLNGEAWTQVIVDLRAHPGGSRDSILSYGIRFPSINLGVVTSLSLDQIMAGPGVPVFENNTVTANLMFLNDNGKVIFDYENISAPDQTGTFPFNIDNSSDASEDLTGIADQPEVQVVDTDTQCTTSADADSDGNGEIAVDTDCNGCFGDAYLDPDTSSVACIRTDGNNNGCEDFFIDTNGDGCQDQCPDVFWDPTTGIISAIHQASLDINGDGTPDQVCAFDSDGDGEDDSFIDPDSENPNSGQVGGQGVGQANPFDLSGQGCSLQAVPNRVAPSQALWGLWILGMGWLMGARMRKAARTSR